MTSECMHEKSVPQNAAVEICSAHVKDGTIALIKHDLIPAGRGKDAKLSLALNTL